jgi:hypothetical protein
MEKDKLKFYNRYGANIWLEHIQDDLWKLNSKEKEDLEYIRIISNEDKSLYAVDPSGGPFIYVGMFLIRNMKRKKGFIDKLYNVEEILDGGFTLRLKEINVLIVE